MEPLRQITIKRSRSCPKLDNKQQCLILSYPKIKQDRLSKMTKFQPHRQRKILGVKINETVIVVMLGSRTLAKQLKTLRILVIQ